MESQNDTTPEVKTEAKLPSWKQPKPPAPEPVTVELWYPVQAFGQPVKALKCETLLDGFGLRQLRGLSDEDKAIKIIQLLYRTVDDKELTFDNACSLKADDIRRLGEACFPFTGSGLTI